MCSIKTPQTGPSSLVLATFSWFYPLIFKVNMERSQAAGNAQKYWSSCTACNAWCNHDETVTKHYHEKNKHYHASLCYTRANPSTHWLLRRATFASPFRCFKSKALRLWCMRCTRQVEGFFSATQQQVKQVKQVPGHCHYRPLGAVGIADTSIFQLVLITNFQRQHGKVKLHWMPRPAGPGMSRAILCFVFCRRRLSSED